MPKVICTLPNASFEISGVKFTQTEDRMAVVSEEISDEKAEMFLSIPGYELEVEDPEAAEKAAAAAEIAAQKATAKAAALKAAASKSTADKKSAGKKVAAKAPEAAPVVEPAGAPAPESEYPAFEPAVAAPEDDTVF